MIYRAQGDFAEAVAELKQVVELERRAPHQKTAYVTCQGKAGQRALRLE